jgi:hypothetical protein
MMGSDILARRKHVSRQKLCRGMREGGGKREGEERREEGTQEEIDGRAPRSGL